MCSNGLVGVGSSQGFGDVCCPADCGVCGGAGCSSVGEELGLACCTSEVFNAGEMCSVKRESPCIIDDSSKLLQLLLLVVAAASCSCYLLLVLLLLVLLVLVLVVHAVTVWTSLMQAGGGACGVPLPMGCTTYYYAC